MISDEIIKVFDYLADKVGILIDWSSEEVVPYIESICGKYINWELTTSFASLILFIVGIIAAIKLWQRGVKVAKGEDDFFQDEANTLWMFPLAFFVFIICTGFVINEISDIIKCMTFPELQLYEFLSELIKEIS